MQPAAAKSSRAQSVPNVRAKFVFGLTTGVSGNCLYMNDHTIVYPVAGVVVVYDMEIHSQKFIKLKAPRRIITAMDLNATRHVFFFPLTFYRLHTATRTKNYATQHNA